MRGMGRDIIPAGRRLVVETPGGAGIGDPAERSPESLSADIRAGFVSGGAAKSAYKSKRG